VSTSAAHPRATVPRSPDPAPGERARLVYLVLAAAYVTALLLANIVGVKLFRIELGEAWGHAWVIKHSVGMISFPITFVLTDLLNEYWGRRGARRVIFLAFAMGVLAFLILWVARKVPAWEGVPNTATQAEVEAVFGASALMYVASLLAFLLGSVLDVVLFGFFKRLTAGRAVWLRATGSTVVSQLFDSLAVTGLYFAVIPGLLGRGAAPLGDVVGMALTGYWLKFALAVLLTPAIYAGRWGIRRYAGLAPLPPGAPGRE